MIAEDKIDKLKKEIDILLKKLEPIEKEIHDKEHEIGILSLSIPPVESDYVK